MVPIIPLHFNFPLSRIPIWKKALFWSFSSRIPYQSSNTIPIPITVQYVNYSEAFELRL